MSTIQQTHDAAGQTLAGTAGQPLAPRAFLVVYPNAAGAGDARSVLVDLPEGVEATIGRTRAGTIAIDDEQVSRAHARVVRRGSEITVEDLGSRNGTWVNGQRIGGPTRVAPGDEIGVGPAVLVVGVSTQLRRQTSVGSVAYLEERLAAETDRAVRYRRPLGLVMMRIVGPVDLGEAAVERVAEALRRMDCLAEYGPDELAVLLPEADRAAAEAAAHRLARDARGPGGVVVHVGVAAHPEDGSQPGELLSRARAALRAARTGAGAEGVALAPHDPPIVEGDLVIADPAMRRLYQLVERIAVTPMTVLVLGETGVGKELVAEALHRRSPRAKHPLVKLNCASLPETLLESELFGYERGAFTGADRRKIGFFEAASGGTIVLDEIAELPLGLQSKLLRVLELRTLARIGGTAELEVDVRVVCSTNRDLELEVRQKRFREDLYYRVSAFTLVVPPLRDRPAEILPLAEHFARTFATELGQPPPTLAPPARGALCRYPWPGNVRELRNAMERAVVLQTAGVIEVEHLPDRIREAVWPGAGEVGPALVAVGDGLDMKEHIAAVERAAVAAALDACGGNQTRAAAQLGISRRALIYKMEKHGLKAQPGGK